MAVNLKATFGEYAALGKYNRITKTVQCNWSILNEKFVPLIKQLSEADSVAATEDRASSLGNAYGSFVEGNGLFTCSLCNFEGDDLRELKDHCKSKEHVDKVRERGVGLEKNEESDTDDSDADSDASDNEWEDEITTLADTQARRWNRRLIDRIVFWERPNIIDQRIGISICSTLLPGDTDEEISQSFSKLLDSSEPYWILIILRSGRFAGAVFDTRTNKVVAHKTIKKYTVRAKAGGAQSAQDGTGRKPKSAGSSLRRYGEQRLEEDTLALMKEWQPYFKQGRFFASVNAALRPLIVKAVGEHVKITRLPFMASKVTGEQVTVLYEQLRTIHLTIAIPPELLELEAKERKANKKKANPQLEVQKVAESGPVYTYVEEEDELFSDLHRAARDNEVAVIIHLMDQGSDPTAKDGKGRMPWFLCQTQDARDSIRRYAARNLDKYDWAEARIDPLTEEMEDKKQQKLKDKKKRQKGNQKKKKAGAREEAEAEAERLRLEEEAKKGPPCQLCGTLCGEIPFMQFDYNYCSMDCVKKHQREQAAAAAEARFEKKVQPLFY